MKFITTIFGFGYLVFGAFLIIVGILFLLLTTVLGIRSGFTTPGGFTFSLVMPLFILLIPGVLSFWLGRKLRQKTWSFRRSLLAAASGVVIINIVMFGSALLILSGFLSFVQQGKSDKVSLGELIKKAEEYEKGRIAFDAKECVSKEYAVLDLEEKSFTRIFVQGLEGEDCKYILESWYIGRPPLENGLLFYTRESCAAKRNKGTIDHNFSAGCRTLKTGYLPQEELRENPATMADAERKADLQLYKAALDWLYEQNNQYPTTDNLLRRTEDAVCPLVVSDQYQTRYLTICPKPLDADDKWYGYRSDGKDYELTAVLENPADSTCVLEGNVCIYRIRDGQVVSGKKQ